MVIISDDLKPILRLGVIRLEGLRTVETGTASAEAPPSQTVSPAGVSEDRVTAVRSMYRRLGIDPTKTRPSSEALLRRVHRGESLPRINTLVDVCNRCSLETQLPYGLYDLRCIEGTIHLRVGQSGDEYEGIRKRVVHLAGRPALFDQRGPFGNPTADSARTMVTTDTTGVCVVVFAPRVVPRPDVEAVLDLTASRVLATAGGRELGRWVVGDER